MSKEQHLLTILGEECAEVAQLASKSIRFGLENMRPGQYKTNFERLEEELGQLMAMADMIGLTPCPKAYAEKPKAVAKYMAISKELGLL
jgi:hypothetical protein